MLTRRTLLRSLMLAGGFSLLPMGGRAWALAAPAVTRKHFIMILMRGAVDGLSVVTPYMERNYYNNRTSIALPPPGQNDGLLYLDGFFGLHPSLASIQPLWQNRSLSFIQACGSTAETRSHFEAQDIMETALLNSALAQQGWMNGLAQVLPDNHSSTRTLSFGDVLPKIFQGHENISTVPSSLRSGGQPSDGQMDRDFARLYGNRSELGLLYNQAVSARDTMTQDLNEDADTANKGAPGGDAFVQQCAKAAGMIHHDPSVQLVFMDVGGWDTHVNQGNAKGQLANRLERLGEGLATLAQDLGDEYSNTVILVMSEFGRTVAQNGNGGTDHGHGNVAWIMGGAVNGGKVYSRWPGLEPNQLWEGRDLAVTTDFRSVIGTLVGGHFGLDTDAMKRVIPEYVPDYGLSSIIG